MNDNVINANPTKGFFIDMLTRDIRLDRAIIDLIDNCIDGAKNIKSDENYSGLKIDLSFSDNSFQIIDNCGGFSLDTAKNYAFRFGRPNVPQAKFVDHSIGRFGVGMKRSLFKMGKHFIVESKCKKDHFLIEVFVDDWVEEKEWTFNYIEKQQIAKEKSKLEGRPDGTVITILDLYENIKLDFASNEFKQKLKKEISLALSYSILKSIEINVNASSIERADISFLEKDGLKSLNINRTIGDVNVRLYVGIGDYSPTKAGWYIFCNDRLVLEADKSYTTGWKENKDDEGSVVKYHHDYAMFRGAVFFDAKDSSKLPMTTTKTGIDSDHPVFKSVRPIMLNAMKQVISFLKKVENKDEGELIINESATVPITQMRTSSSNYSENFVYPTTQAMKSASKFVGISYKKEKDVVEKVKEFAGISSNKDLGEFTFDYYCKLNNID